MAISILRSSGGYEIARRITIMAGRNRSDEAAKSGPAPFLGFGQAQTEAATALQKEFVHAYEDASHAWLARVQSEAVMWSDLATKLAATRTVPEILEAYSQCASQRMQVAAEDGRRLFEQSQQITQKINRSLANVWPKGST
jgi:Phasin protein